MLPGGADALWAEFEAVRADAVAVTVVVVDALVFGVGFSEDGVVLVRLPDRQEALVVVGGVDVLVFVGIEMFGAACSGSERRGMPRSRKKLT